MTPVLEEYAEDYIRLRADYLGLLRRISDKLADEIAAVEDVEPYDHEVFRRDCIANNRDFTFSFHKKMVLDAAERKAQLQYVAGLIDRRGRELGLDNRELWQHIANRFT